MVSRPSSVAISCEKKKLAEAEGKVINTNIRVVKIIVLLVELNLRGSVCILVI